MSFGIPQKPLDILRTKLVSTLPPSPKPTSPERYKPYDEPFLPTPPPESALPANKATIYIPAPIHPEALAYAKTRFGRVIVNGEVGEGEGWGMADAVLNRANPINRQLQQAPKLLAISVVGVGYDSIDIQTCKDKRIVVTNCPGANADAVAELTLSLTLTLLRRVAELDRRLRNGERMLSINVLGRSLRGKVVGMIGMGDTARRAAELFHNAFNCEIHIYSPTSPPTRWTTHDPLHQPLPHTRHSTLSTLLPLIDILTLHCPLTSETRNLISEPELRVMKKDSILINMSRGAVVDESALFNALQDKAGNGTGTGLMAAASDVFRVEPVHKNSVEGLLDLDNFVATPHIGGSTVEAQLDVCFLAIDQLADVLDGRPVLNRITYRVSSVLDEVVD